MTLQTSIYSTFWLNDSSDSSNNRNCAFAEAIISPAKYALFQILGYHFLLAAHQLDATPPLSSFSAAKVGAFGGTALGLFYVFMLFKRRNPPRNDVPYLEPHAFSMLCKEMACSAVASIIGAYADGFHDHCVLFFLTISGFLGPFIFLVILFGVLGLVIAVVRNIAKLKSCWVGY
ncbi:hypothetical protein GALMADRAFT_231233 [Galerina marginata CBS 339.88]|uniref:Uncharacterized protein n=1 Tax=Galerina marginata (strain CBS 339.88) TaxID=685588 RepID=A0A067SCC6_GALM3|nr:hypothetical protein GALMADRAFT_231233 [Galerina marginata CBS 339.88]